MIADQKKLKSRERMAIFSIFSECRAPQKRSLHVDSDDDLTDDIILLNSTRTDSRRLSTRRPSKVREEVVRTSMALDAEISEGKWKY